MNMKKTIFTFLFVLIPILANAQNQNQQTHQAISALKKKLNNTHPNSSKSRKLVQLNKNEVEEIEIYKDGDMTNTGYAFHIHIYKERVTRHAGEWDGMCGIIDTYYTYGSSYYERAIKAINSGGIYLVPNKKPQTKYKGTTQIIVKKGEKEIYNLIVSPELLNVQGDFFKLVNSLVEMTGGEPEFGGPVIDGPIIPDEIDTEDIILDYTN